jgi:FKBP-type peptidyl-prolyl cis-trans isomerase FkpA
MNKFKYYFVLLLAGIAMVSCNKSDDDDVVVVPLRDYAVQYKADNDSILKYLKTNYIEEVTADFDIKISKIPAGGTQISIWDQQDYPLKTREVYRNDITYTVYYLSLREGIGQAPMNTDRISTSYVGNLLDGTVFDTSYNIARTFDLYGQAANAVFVEGWKEIFPKFKTGTSTTADNGVITYNDFGAGVMFVPSGLAYYGSGADAIPAYSPLVFSFKLFDIVRLDHDFDGVFDIDEDINHDGYVYDFSNTTIYPNPPANLIDDTDGDGIADFLDSDDDGDGFTTFFEISKPIGQIGIVDGVNYGLSTFYPWDPIVDNPATPNTDETEPRGIPRRPTGALTNAALPESATNPRAYVKEDYEEKPRLRIHLDKTYPYKKQ